MDLSRELRRVLVELRPTSVAGLPQEQERHLLRTRFSVTRGTILDSDNLYHRIFLPVIAKAGIRRVRLHDLRHTFGSLLLQNGATIVYVKEQMGHSSIQVTVDTYGHLIPTNVCFVGRLDEVSPEEAETAPQAPRNKANWRFRRISCKLLI